MAIPSAGIAAAISSAIIGRVGDAAPAELLVTRAGAGEPPRGFGGDVGLKGICEVGLKERGAIPCAWDGLPARLPLVGLPAREGEALLPRRSLMPDLRLPPAPSDISLSLMAGWGALAWMSERRKELTCSLTMEDLRGLTPPAGAEEDGWGDPEREVDVPVG